MSKQINTNCDTVLKSECDKICELFPNVWKNELGTVKDVVIEIKFKKELQPVFCKPRRIPFSLQKDVDSAIDDGISRGVWKTTDFSDFGTPIVVVHKKGINSGIRVCGDYRVTVNKYLEDHRHPIPLPDELIAQLGGKYFFSKLDLKDAYNQIRLHPDSQKKLALSTTRGVLLQTRLPFGIKSAPGYFQDVMSKITCDLKGVVVYFDDILVSGVDRTDHLSNLKSLLNRFNEKGIRLNRDKCVFAEPEITYLGHIISQNGITMGPKADDVLKMPRPTNINELKSFLGAIQFYNKFIENFSTIAGPLYNLTKNDAIFHWSNTQQHAFDHLKQILASDQILVHFDQNLPVGISCDASNIGIGCVLFHRFKDSSERPICYASKVLSETQKRYSQIHKEALAIIFALKRFHMFLYGRKFVIITDHKPLVSIFSPSKSTSILTANRLARWVNILNQYDFDVEYRHTLLHGNADVLSRFPVGQDKNLRLRRGERRFKRGLSYKFYR
ncbi:Retrovirus-related Pol polyprotein from transposon 17.6 [Thelohanellus kitauei]|uniref:Retrovirus-related Pol polyprotein from transposon 17.6 n=1 Tax=Thelohanellus kitauei TaxID=669202 RepID=A0A0C2I8K5_THEKT|nr:Retrovirus-related Pol polyprotein from transposon 17.6 [Thelohanellus kitauei]